MPSSYTASLRFELQAPGENLNTWGVRLNTALSRIDFSVAGISSIPLTGNYTLTTSNTVDDQARAAILKFTGVGPFTVTIPSVSKIYTVWNACSADLLITLGAGDTVTISAGEIATIFSDAANVKRVLPQGYGGQRISVSAAPTSGDHLANKAYVDGQAFGAANLPGQNPGTVGQTIFSDGTVAGWRGIEVADVNGAAPLASPDFTGGMAVTGATKYAPVTVPALDIDWSDGDLQIKGLAASGAITFSGFTAGKGQALILKLTISASAVPTWPAAVTWDNGVDPALPNGLNVVGFTTFDGGVTIEGYVLGEAFA